MFKRKLKRMKKQGERWKKVKELQDAYAPYAPARKKRKVSNVMLVVIVLAIVLYTIAAFWLQKETGIPIDTTLSTLWFGFWTVEIVSLMLIKNTKTKRDTNDNTGEM
jgi:hypothetical protein